MIKLKNQCGLTLLELMLAMALGLVLISGLITVYLSIEHNQKMSNALADIQENARFAIYYLDKAIAQAGLNDCGNNEVNHLKALQGFLANSVPKKWKIKAKKDTDVLVIGKCRHYQQKYQFIRMAYFIGDTHRFNYAKQKIYALYRKPFAGRREEIVQNVNNLKIRYGMSNLTATKVKIWQAIRNVWLALVFNSSEPILKKSQPYWLFDHYILPKDKRLYKAWQSYVILREPLIN